jgi:hypothetical protein
MGRIEVDPTALLGGSGRAMSLADEVDAVRSGLLVAAGQIEAALEDGGAGGAAADALTSWATALGQLGGSSMALGTNLDGAAGAYVETDSTAIAGGS